MNLDAKAKAYGQSRALCGESPLLAPLDVSIAALQQGLSITCPEVRKARRLALHEFFKLSRRLTAARLRHLSKSPHGERSNA